MELLNTRMDNIIRLIHTLDNKSICEQEKLADVQYMVSKGIITSDEAVDLVTAYDIII